MIAAPVSSVYPGMGTQVLIICFVVVVIGGIGSIWGALFARLLIGLADTFGKVLISRGRGRHRLSADGGHPAVAPRRPVQAGRLMRRRPRSGNC
jgi:ABC-type branched-subunit amino acid transport system permease subunit